MTEAEILEMTYFDRCTIRRKEKIKDANTGVTTTSLKVIKERIKCALSKKDTIVNSLTVDGVGNATMVEQLFLSPSVDVKLGDSIEVTSSLNKGNYLASQIFNYPSYTLILLKRGERV